MNFDRPPQNEKGNESLEKLGNIQEVLSLNPELAEAVEKASRSYLVDSLKTEKELPQDLKEYYEKHSENKEWLDILSVYPADLQRKIVEKRPDGTEENILEIRDRLSEEWAKVSEKFMDKLYSGKCVRLENLFDQLPYKRGELISQNDEREINTLISDITHWLDKFAGIYQNKSKVFPDENVRKTFGVSDYSPDDLTLTEVRENKEWHEKLDFFIQQYFKFFAAGTKENRLESAIHFLDFAEYFIKKDDERYHSNWLLLKDNLDLKNLTRNKDVREFIPEDITKSTGLSSRLWYYGNQNNLKYARILPAHYNIQTKFNNYSEPKLEVSSGAKELYEKYVETIFPESKIKDIVWHSSEDKFDEFNKEKIGTGIDSKVKVGVGNPFNAFYFAPSTAWHNDPKNEWKPPNLMPVVLNLKNPLQENLHTVEKNIAHSTDPRFGYAANTTKNHDGAILFEDDGKPNQILVFSPENIHILGSKKDIEEFKNWSEKKI